MTDLAYFTEAAVLTFFGAVFGVFLYWLRSFVGNSLPEKFFAGDDLTADLLNALSTNHDYLLEKHVLGTDFDKDGYWDAYSLRNFIFYVALGASLPVLLAINYWPERAHVVAMTCNGLVSQGLHPPLCPASGR